MRWDEMTVHILSTETRPSDGVAVLRAISQIMPQGATRWPWKTVSRASDLQLAGVQSGGYWGLGAMDLVLWLRLLGAVSVKSLSLGVGLVVWLARQRVCQVGGDWSIKRSHSARPWPRHRHIHGGPKKRKRRLMTTILSKLNRFKTIHLKIAQ